MSEIPCESSTIWLILEAKLNACPENDVLTLMTGPVLECIWQDIVV